MAAFVGTETRLLKTDEISVNDCRCRAGRGFARGDEFTTTNELIFVRRGAFTARIGSDELLMTSAHVLLLRSGTRYRIDHPSHEGDECTVFALSDPAMDELSSIASAAFERPRALSGTSAFFLQQQLHRELLHGAMDARAAEERAWRVVAEFERAGGPPHPVRMSARTRRAVADAQELISVHYTQTLPLATVARQVGLSRFHLCRYFRAATGTSLHRFQTSLRLREALRRVGDGATDLTALALDLGFADHSHFTTAFQQEFGIAPSRLRRSSRSRQ